MDILEDSFHEKLKLNLLMSTLPSRMKSITRASQWKIVNPRDQTSPLALSCVARRILNTAVHLRMRHSGNTVQSGSRVRGSASLLDKRYTKHRLCRSSFTTVIAGLSPSTSSTLSTCATGNTFAVSSKSNTRTVFQMLRCTSTVALPLSANE